MHTVFQVAQHKIVVVHRDTEYTQLVTLYIEEDE